MSKNSKKESQRKKRRLFLAIIMILFVGVVLTTSTYAWFTANRTVTVDAIDVTVTTSEGLQISTDATNWKSVVTNADITGAGWSGVNNQLPQGANLLSPVSTDGTVDSNGYMEFFKGTIESDATTGNNLLTAVKSTETNGTAGDFVAFDLFFQSTQEQDIYLTSNSSVVAKGTSTGIENAARVALIKEGSVAYGSAASAAYAIKGSQNKFIWEPNYDVHTTAAIANALNNYGATIPATGGSKVAYKGVTAAIPTGVALNSTDSAYFADVNPATTGSLASGIPTTGYLSLFKVAAGITKVRIYMWIEGQDYDCEDRASGGSLTYSLQFSIDDKAA